MHVREKAEERGVIRQGAVHFDRKIVSAGWNQKTVVRELQSKYALRGLMLRENNSGAGRVRARFAICCVMHLENQIRSGGNKFRHCVGEIIRRTSRRVNEKHVAIRPMRFMAEFFIMEAAGREWNADRSFAQPF